MECVNMVDVVSHECFPTLVHEFRLNLNHDKMIDYIYNVGEAKGQIHQSHDDLHKYGIDKIEITNMWSNHMYSGDSHPPHTHSNNFLSGVYYLYGGVNTSPIQFFDPRPAATVLRPRNKANWNNSSMIQFDSVNGIGLIFPSWLQHWVPSTQHERISVSWNVLVRGHYGEPKTLQNAYI